MDRQNASARRVRLFAACFVFILVAGSRVNAEPINLMWDPSRDAVNGYIVHVGAQAGSYTLRYDVGAMTSFTYPDAVAGQRYCFAVSAYASAGESPLSSAVCGYSDAPPTLTNPGNQSSVAGRAVSLQLTGADPYGQPVTYSAAGLPPGLSLQAATGFISGAGTTAGTYPVTARVFDGRLSAAQSFTWTMAPPVVTAPTVAITVPTAAATFATTGSLLSLRGTASASAGVSQVTWANDRGGNGTATGTTDWSTASIPLQGGVNVLTVVARDGAGNQAADVLTVTYTIPQTIVTLTARPYTQRGMKYVALTWTAAPWQLADVLRDGLPLTTTENDGSHLDSMKKGRSYTYRLCETGNRTNCSNSVTVYF
jgi:Putative Ig domain